MFVVVILSNVGQDCDPHESVDYFQDVAGISTSEEEAETIGKSAVARIREMNSHHPELDFDYCVIKRDFEPTLFVANS